MSAKLYHLHWFKHSAPNNAANLEAGFEYYVEGLGKVSIKTTLPFALAERLDAIGKQALWEKIGDVKKGKIKDKTNG